LGMGKTILTARQRDFLELAQKEHFVTNNFYFTGGTALAEFHLQHRLSDDIDLFSEKTEVNAIFVEKFLKQVSPKLGIKKIKRSNFFGLISYHLVYEDDQELKVDFNYYPFLRIDKSLKFGKLEVDSIRDIAANKIHTVYMRPRSRDYIDLYFIHQKMGYDLRSLILDAKAKFDWDIKKLDLASQFLRAGEITKDPPKMLVDFDQKEMESFFADWAKSLEDDILK
ncbi:MAG: nucleotidyl transferase AbiEii/AbiGii toxin family protein, partial [Patescibacteria group bacterium]